MMEQKNNRRQSGTGTKEGGHSNRWQAVVSPDVDRVSYGKNVYEHDSRAAVRVGKGKITDERDVRVGKGKSTDERDLRNSDRIENGKNDHIQNYRVNDIDRDGKCIDEVNAKKSYGNDWRENLGVNTNQVCGFVFGSKETGVEVSRPGIRGGLNEGPRPKNKPRGKEKIDKWATVNSGCHSLLDHSKHVIIGTNPPVVPMKDPDRVGSPLSDSNSTLRVLDEPKNEVVSSEKLEWKRRARNAAQMIDAVGGSSVSIELGKRHVNILIEIDHLVEDEGSAKRGKGNAKGAIVDAQISTAVDISTDRMQ
ncbi:hypothetical protein Q3G72_018816 [Acer saccharum]|nr:hypothetical protein Q3G72_018816 [Acer saccharum]